jgi:hypothetical protein
MRQDIHRRRHIQAQPAQNFFGFLAEVIVNANADLRHISHAPFNFIVYQNKCNVKRFPDLLRILQ